MMAENLISYASSFLAYLGTDPIQWIRMFYLAAASAIAIINSFPALEERFVHYGARSSTVKDEHGKPVEREPPKGLLSKGLDMLASFRVPHSWFIHFYIASVASSIFWAWQILSKGVAFQTLARLHLESGNRIPSANTSQAALAWLLMAAQGVRRLYECITLSKPSSSKMAGPAWILGLSFYVVIGMAIWIEAIPNLVAVKSIPHAIAFSKIPFLKAFIGTSIFAIASIVQHECHTYLASLKKYSLPESPMFRWVISPHYTAECLIYLGIAIVCAPTGCYLNKSITVALFFEVINLGVTAESTRAWYCKKFGEDAVNGRWRMIPYVY